MIEYIPLDSLVLVGFVRAIYYLVLVGSDLQYQAHLVNTTNVGTYG